MFRGALQPSHLVIMLVAVLLLFGSAKLPMVAKSIGQSLRIFKREVGELADSATPSPDSAGEGRPEDQVSGGGADTGTQVSSPVPEKTGVRDADQS